MRVRGQPSGDPAAGGWRPRLPACTRAVSDHVLKWRMIPSDAEWELWQNTLRSMDTPDSLAALHHLEQHVQKIDEDR